MHSGHRQRRCQPQNSSGRLKPENLSLLIDVAEMATAVSISKKTLLDAFAADLSAGEAAYLAVQLGCDPTNPADPARRYVAPAGPVGSSGTVWGSYLQQMESVTLDGQSMHFGPDYIDSKTIDLRLSSENGKIYVGCSSGDNARMRVLIDVPAGIIQGRSLPLNYTSHASPFKAFPTSGGRRLESTTVWAAPPTFQQSGCFLISSQHIYNHCSQLHFSVGETAI